MFTASQLQSAIDGTMVYEAVTYCGCGLITLTRSDADHIELACTYGGDEYGPSEFYDLSFYSRRGLLTAINEYAQEWADDLKNEIA